jgi:acyl-coenzyme A synthetase/AMP-(fatty) acid ligase/aryl carrier-like protein
MVEHRGVVNRLNWMQAAYELDPTDAVLQKTPFSFDVSVWEFFWPLMVSARLVLLEPQLHKEPDRLATVMRRERIDTLHFVPSMLTAFLPQAEVARFADLTRVVCSGEVLPVATARRFHELLPEVDLQNLYGPTEAAVDVTAWPCSGVYDGASIPIGKPIDNVRLYVLDERYEPVPVGSVGELYIGGTQVARGYHDRTRLTAERFVPDPFGDEAGARLYRTGDLGRWRRGGVLEFVGRNDGQVKVRGFRIELGEIESALVERPDIQESVVVPLTGEDGRGDRRLVAYLVGGGPADELRSYLLDRLPEHMVPAAFVRLDALPLTPNGKLARASLPEPDGHSYARRGYEPPRGETEQLVSTVWSEVLDVERVGRWDDFFELGGHSLLIMGVVRRLERHGIESEVRDLFQAPTLADFASRVGNPRHDVEATG